MYINLINFYCLFQKWCGCDLLALCPTCYVWPAIVAFFTRCRENRNRNRGNDDGERGNDGDDDDQQRRPPIVRQPAASAPNERQGDQI